MSPMLKEVVLHELWVTLPFNVGYAKKKKKKLQDLYMLYLNHFAELYL